MEWLEGVSPHLVELIFTLERQGYFIWERK